MRWVGADPEVTMVLALGLAALLLAIVVQFQSKGTNVLAWAVILLALIVALPLLP